MAASPAGCIVSAGKETAVGALFPSRCEPVTRDVRPTLPSPLSVRYAKREDVNASLHFPKGFFVSIRFECPKCHKPIRVADELARRGVKCPSCRAAVRVPPAEFSASDFWQGGAHDENTYELGEQPVSPWAQPSASLKAPADREPDTGRGRSSPHRSHQRNGAETAKRKPTDGRYVRGAQDVPEAKRRPRLLLFGVEVSPVVAAAVVGLVVLACVATVLWYRNTLGQPVRLVTAQPVHSTVLLEGLTIREGMNSAAASIVASTGLGAAVKQGGRTFGGDDRIVATSPGADGDHLVVEVAIQVKFLRERGRISREQVTLRARDFELVDPKGRAIEPESLLTQRFGSTATLQLKQASGPSYRTLLPPGHEPTGAVVSDPDARAPAGGTVEYLQGSGEVEGRLTFADRSAASERAPGVRGFDAYGRLEMQTAGGEAAYLYEGDRLRVKLPRSGEGWWATERETHDVGASPFDRIRATLLFELPDDPDAKHEVHFANRKVATVIPSRHADRTELQTLAVAETGRDDEDASSRASGGGSAGGSSSNGGSPSIGGYFDVMLDARDRARGLAMEATLRQINLALQMYMVQHDEAPRDFDDLAPFLGVHPSGIAHPRTGETPGFIYVPPPEGADPDQTPVIFEALDGRPDFSGARVYLSGRIDRGTGAP